jgi:hypothetical protein
VGEVLERPGRELGAVGLAGVDGELVAARRTAAERYRGDSDRRNSYDSLWVPSKTNGVHALE